MHELDGVSVIVGPRVVFEAIQADGSCAEKGREEVRKLATERIVRLSEQESTLLPDSLIQVFLRDILKFLLTTIDRLFVVNSVRDEGVFLNFDRLLGLVDNGIRGSGFLDFLTVGV